MVVLAQMKLETVTVLGGVGAVRAPVLVNVGVAFKVRVEHRLVDARVVAFCTLIRLGTHVVAKMVLQVVLVLGDKSTFGAVQHFLGTDVSFVVVPELLFGYSSVLALLAFEGLQLK